MSHRTKMITGLAAAGIAASALVPFAAAHADARPAVKLYTAHARLSRSTGVETLQAYLTDGAGKRLAGKNIAFTSRRGYALCAARTDRTGVAVCKADPRGSQADPGEMMNGVRATFAGDRAYRPATGTAPTDVIFP